LRLAQTKYWVPLKDCIVDSSFLTATIHPANSTQCGRYTRNLTSLKLDVNNSQLYLNGSSGSDLFLTVSYDLDITIRLSRAQLVDQAQEEKKLIKMMDEQQFFTSPDMH
jgi:hypothetical protein